MNAPLSHVSAPRRFHFNYGPRLSFEQYERSIIALNDAVPARLTQEQDVALQRAEFDLLIDYRLGTEFPQGRRHDVWSTLRTLDRYRPWHLLRGFFSTPLDPSRIMVSEQIKALAAVLGQEELEAFFDLTATQVTLLKERGHALPVDGATLEEDTDSTTSEKDVDCVTPEKE